MAEPFLFSPVKVIIIVIVAFLPAIIYTILIRYSEKYNREPWGSIGQAFLWGATLAIVLVILIRGFFRIHFEENFPEIASDERYMSFLIVCLITPVFAEIIKTLGLLSVRGDLLEAEDGLIYGAVIGLGYTATDSLLYGLVGLGPLYGIEMFVTVVFMRSMSVMFIQSSTTALTCYGITRAMKVKHKTGSFLTFPLFLLAAIGIHAAFNYIIFMDLFNVGKIDILFSMSSGLFFSIIFAFALMITIYFKIYKLDRSDEAEEEERKQRQLEAERSWEQPMPPRRAPENDYYYNRAPMRPRPRSQHFMQLYDPPTANYYARGPPPRVSGAPRQPRQRQTGPGYAEPRHSQWPPRHVPGAPRPPGTPRPPRSPRAPRPPGQARPTPAKTQTSVQPVRAPEPKLERKPPKIVTKPEVKPKPAKKTKEEELEIDEEDYEGDWEEEEEEEKEEVDDDSETKVDVDWD